MFVDDIIVCGRADNDDANVIASIINEFCAVSRQTPNWNKSAILSSKHIDDNFQNQSKNTFPACNMDPNATHLCHPLILPGNNRPVAYNFIVDKSKAKLNCYKPNKLSHAGRLT